MDFLGFSFSVVELVIIGVFILAFLFQLFFFFRYLNGVLRLRNNIKKDKVLFQTEQLPVSVIICAKDEADNLRRFLPTVLEQDYPNFEVIVINDGSTDETDHLLRDMVKEYSNLRITFVPVEANNLSTKKLGLTLGIKAAKHDWLLFTDADCVPVSKNWIASMARNFTPSTDFVLGYGSYLYKPNFLNRLITYDTLFIALQYLGMAIARKPYMGVGRNLAYRKEVFFKQNGFASTLHLASGDDDLMVNKAATANNTRVEISPDSITVSEPKTNYKSWFYQKERHLSVSSFYSDASKFRLSIEPLSRGLFYLSFILALVFGNLVTILAAIVLFLVRLIIDYAIINGSAKHFGEKKFILSLPVLDVFLPLVSAYVLTIGKARRRKKSIKWK